MQSSSHSLSVISCSEDKIYDSIEFTNLSEEVGFRYRKNTSRFMWNKNGDMSLYQNSQKTIPPPVRMRKAVQYFST